MQHTQNVVYFPPVLNSWYNLSHMVDALIQISHINLNLTPAAYSDISRYLRLQAAAW